MQISLSPELEELIRERVKSGMYTNNSEVVRAALRRFFHVSGDDAVTQIEAEYIRESVGPRLEALKNGSANMQDFDQAMAEIEQDVFGERV